jgi:hypothetical protein
MSMDDFLADYALAAFNDNQEDGREMLFRRLAERIRNGTLQDHPGLTAYLADACDAISSGEEPKKALGLSGGGQKKKRATYSQGLHIALNVRYAMNLWPEKPQEEIFELVAEEAKKHGYSVSDKRVEQYYSEHRSGIEKTEKMNPNSKLWWRPGVGEDDTFRMPIE